jgi:hypothetical protein
MYELGVEDFDSQRNALKSAEAREAARPIGALACVARDTFVGLVDLHPVVVELHLVEPTHVRWQMVAQGRNARGMKGECGTRSI